MCLEHYNSYFKKRYSTHGKSHKVWATKSRFMNEFENPVIFSNLVQFLNVIIPWYQVLVQYQNLWKELPHQMMPEQVCLKENSFTVENFAWS